MDIGEIFDIFEVSNVSNIIGEGNIVGEGSEDLGNNSSCSESVLCSSDDDMEDTYNSFYGCNFEDEFAVDCTTDFEKINFKELSSDEIMMYHFLDRGVAFKFYNMYGCVHGFAGRRCRVVKNKDGDVIQQTFVCHREGLRDARNVNNLSRKREHKPTSRCGCMAKIQVHVDYDSDRWYIKMFDDIHNHTFLDEKYEGMLPAHRKMSDYDKFQMKAMRKAGIPTSRIYGFFASQAGGFKNLGYSRRTMYNEQFKERERKSSDADDAIEFLKGLSRTANAVLKCGNPEYIHKTMEMVENHTETLESFNRGEIYEMSLLGPETGRSLANPQRLRKRGGPAADSSARNAKEKKKRNTPKCGICGGKGHNRVSCRFRQEATIPSETHSSNSNHEQQFYDDFEDWNVPMDLN